MVHLCLFADHSNLLIRFVNGIDCRDLNVYLKAVKKGTKCIIFIQVWKFEDDVLTKGTEYICVISTANFGP